MENNRLFLDIHAIQTVPPSNINRDDTGSPKTAQYGGVTRARVSSQCWKKAIRDYFCTYVDITNLGVRTKDIVTYVAEKIRDKDGSKSKEEAIKMAEEIINTAGVTTKGNQGKGNQAKGNQAKANQAKALLFLGVRTAEKLAEAALNQEQDKKNIQAIIKEDPAIDIALFGRMVAYDPSLNEDASCQVAHAISTHAIVGEYDYFTALDDLSPDDNAGAGMIGTIEYNSSTLYRYANIAVHELVKQLKAKDDAIAAIRLFIEAFVKSMPTGKVNTFANQTLPQAVLVTLRTDRPVSLVSAFEEPIKTKGGYIKKSIEKMTEEYKKVEKMTDAKAKSFILTLDDESPIHVIGKNEKDLTDLLNEVGENISEATLA